MIKFLINFNVLPFTKFWSVNLGILRVFRLKRLAICLKPNRNYKKNLSEVFLRVFSD